MLIVSWDRMELDSTPVEEQCIPASKDPVRHSQQAIVLRRQLERMFPIPESLEGDVRFAVVSSAHDLGTYKQVAVKFNSEMEEACKFAYHVEENFPLHWDERAKAELAWYEKRSEWEGRVSRGELSYHDVPEVFRHQFPPEVLVEA